MHADPRVDALHRDVTALVGTRLTSDRRAIFDEIRALAHERAELPPPEPVAGGSSARAVSERALVLLRGAESGRCAADMRFGFRF